MKLVEGQHTCSKCNSNFDWHFVVLDVGDVFFEEWKTN